MPSDIVYSYKLIKFSTVVVVNGEVIVITGKISNDNLINITIHYKTKKYKGFNLPNTTDFTN